MLQCNYPFFLLILLGFIVILCLDLLRGILNFDNENIHNLIKMYISIMYYNILLIILGCFLSAFTSFYQLILFIGNCIHSLICSEY
jgi:hypothetical protein